MKQVVRSRCPGCKQELRIPAQWVHQPMRCKHCGLVVQAKAPPQPSPPPKARPAAPVAKPAPPPPTAARTDTHTVAGTGVAHPAAPLPVAVPVAPTAVPSDPFGNLDTPSPGVRTRRRRSRGSWWTGVFLLLLLAGVSVGLAIVAAPQLSQLVKEASEPQQAAEHRDKGDPPPRVNDFPTPTRRETVKEPANPPAKKPDDGAPPKKPNPEPPAKKPEETKPPTKPPETTKPAEPVKPPTRPTGDLPRATGVFPRRALAICVSNYLYFNPVSYGMPGFGGSNVGTVMDRLTQSLRIPQNQMVILSDGAGRTPRPPLKAVIESTVEEFLTTSRAQDRLVLMFIGHYVEMGDDVYLVPLEGERGNKDTLIPLKWLYDQLAACKARQKVLVLDVCRFNPARGVERPVSGPAEEVEKLPPGAMGPKLAAVLKAPPPGVQVWSACSEGQFSFEDDEFNNGIFQQALIRTLARAVDGVIQKPDDLIPVETLAERVNAELKAAERRFKKPQVAQLHGKPPEAGAAYNSEEPMPPPPRVLAPFSDASVAGRAAVDAILRELDVPPVKMAPQEMRLRGDSMPLFATKTLQQFALDTEETPFRKAIKKARQLLNDQVKGKILREEFPDSPNKERFKKEIEDSQKPLAVALRELEEMLDEMKAAGKDGREQEKSRGWQATYDYVLARLEAQIAYIYEYQTAMGSMRKDQVPPLEPGVHNGWRLASIPTLQGDSTGKKLAKDSRKLLEKLAQDCPGTPWEVLAKRDQLTNLGLEWQATKIGAQ